MIGSRLRGLREEKALKQADIAKVLGISRTTYTQYETEKRVYPKNGKCIVFPGKKKKRK